MRRRDFIAGLGSVAASPLAARAQAVVRRVGYLSARAPDEAAEVAAAFRRGLDEESYIVGRNIAIEYRWGLEYSQLPTLAAELVDLKVDVIAATGGGVAPLAAKTATATIPIVFVMGDLDPVKSGLVASMNRPGGNITGITPLTSVLAPKRLELLSAMVPRGATIGMLVNPNFADGGVQSRDAEAAVRALGLGLLILNASTEGDFDAAFATFVERRVAALLVGNDSFFISRRELLAALAARHAIPTMYTFREYTLAGGLMSYAPSLVDAHHQAGAYTGRILKGANPAELPVMQPTRFEFVINLKTAKQLGLTIPPNLLAIADEVIE